MEVIEYFEFDILDLLDEYNEDYKIDKKEYNMVEKYIEKEALKDEEFILYERIKLFSEGKTKSNLLNSKQRNIKQEYLDFEFVEKSYSCKYCNLLWNNESRLSIFNQKYLPHRSEKYIDIDFIRKLVFIKTRDYFNDILRIDYTQIEMLYKIYREFFDNTSIDLNEYDIKLWEIARLYFNGTKNILIKTRSGQEIKLFNNNFVYEKVFDKFLEMILYAFPSSVKNEIDKYKKANDIYMLLKGSPEKIVNVIKELIELEEADSKQLYKMQNFRTIINDINKVI